jgi:hypothetical protein
MYRGMTFRQELPMSSLPTAFTISPVVEPTKEDSLRLEYLSEAEFMDRHVRTTHRWQSQRIGPPLVKFGKFVSTDVQPWKHGCGPWKSLALIRATVCAGRPAEN